MEWFNNRVDTFYQVFSYTHKGELRREEGCLASSGQAGSSVRLEPCPVGKPLPKYMIWDYEKETKKFKHRSGQTCLDSEHLSATNFIKLQDCADKDSQKWTMETLM